VKSVNETIKDVIVYGDTVQKSDWYTKTGLSSQSVTTLGKNLFDRSRAMEDKALTWATGIPFSETNSLASDFIRINLNTEYVINYRSQILLYDSNKTFIERYSSFNSGQYSFNISTLNIVYVRLGFRPIDNNSIDMTAISDIQLELGSTATTYTPFIPNSPSPDYPSTITSNLSAGTYKVQGDDGWYEFTLSEELRGINGVFDSVEFDKVSHSGFLRREIFDYSFTGNEALVSVLANTTNYITFQVNLSTSPYGLAGWTSNSLEYLCNYFKTTSTNNVYYGTGEGFAWDGRNGIYPQVRFCFSKNKRLHNGNLNWRSSWIF
jgi:hypothetical protein